jgi:hypothetical protein
MMEPPAEPVRPDLPRPEATRLPALARYWWLTAVRGLVALTLAAVVGALLVLLRHGLAGLVQPELLASTELRPEVIWPVAAAWGVVSGSLLLVEGVRLRRFARAST